MTENLRGLSDKYETLENTLGMFVAWILQVYIVSQAVVSISGFFGYIIFLNYLVLSNARKVIEVNVAIFGTSNICELPILQLFRCFFVKNKNTDTIPT